MSSNGLSVTPFSLQCLYGRGIQPEHSLDFKRTRMGVFVKFYQEERKMEFYPWLGPVAGVIITFLLAGAGAETATQPALGSVLRRGGVLRESPYGVVL